MRFPFRRHGQTGAGWRGLKVSLQRRHSNAGSITSPASKSKRSCSGARELSGKWLVSHASGGEQKDEKKENSLWIFSRTGR
jgi:hypothetical protein